MFSATEPSSSLVWQVKGKHISVALDLEVLKRLQTGVLETRLSQAWRPLEIGGLLLGVKRRKAGLTVVDVCEFDPVRCEHAFGASYLLSPTDRAVLQERIRWHKIRGQRDVIGFYRSHPASISDLRLSYREQQSHLHSRRVRICGRVVSDRIAVERRQYRKQPIRVDLRLASLRGNPRFEFIAQQ